ncbi:MAG TPA: DUF4272 domain-containing protein [Thermomicrobiales bacterium]|nr:DUF4272 domain-containing protein [Thermomicrobiales bacterium]
MEPMPAEEDDSLDITLRDPDEVASRSVVLAALCRRAFLELDAEQTDGSELDEDRFDLLAWLRDEDLSDHFSTEERVIFQAPVGSLDPGDTLMATWSAEALAPLCWALGLLPALPGPDRPANAEALLGLLPSPDSATGSWREDAAMRDEDAIAAAREAAELWAWRATVQELWATATVAERNDRLVAIRDVAHEGAALGLLPPPVDDDIPVLGRAYATAGDHETLAIIAEWRLRALNWLCGFGDSWDTVPLDI